MKRIFFLLLFCSAIGARAQFTGTGTIEFERRRNVQRYMEDYNKQWYDQVKNEVPKYVTRHFTLAFNSTRTLYSPVKEPEDGTQTSFSSPPAGENIVYAQLPDGRLSSAKQVYDQLFIVEDSARRLSWRMLPETRTIAGFNCRKAVSKICDSVYVVAFYTDAIPVSGGPESFSGLPGMILEVAIPRLYCTWTATKVQVSPPASMEFTHEKGKKVNQPVFYETLRSSFSDWGTSMGRNLWWCTL